jgi:hypothetical protein
LLYEDRQKPFAENLRFDCVIRKIGELEKTFGVVGGLILRSIKTSRRKTSGLFWLEGKDAVWKRP